MKDVWVEKYRPATLDEVVGQDEVVERLKAYVKAGNLPHMLFAGPAGTGKTTCAIALARGLFGKDWRGNFSETNASDDRGIDTVRVRIKDAARTKPLGGATFKILFLDEADNLTADAQAALRRTMENFTRTARFIFSVNYSSRIIEPLQSRCAVFRFHPLKPDSIRTYLGRIAKAEELTITPEGYDTLVYIAEGDLRKATNALQVAASVDSKIDATTLYKTAATARPEAIRKLLETSLGGDFLGAREELDTLLIDAGLSGEDVLRQIHRSLFDLNVPDTHKVRMVDALGETDFRLVEGGNERIQLENLLSRFVLIGQDLKKK